MHDDGEARPGGEVAAVRTTALRGDGADPRSRTAHAGRDRRADPVAATRALLSGRLGGVEPPRIAEVAARLGMGPRRLQQLLRREGTTYRAVLEAVRRERALGRVQGEDTALCEVALALGYADQSAFTRAFRRWTGQPPSRARAARRGGPGRAGEERRTPDPRTTPSARRSR